jgi:hypothetical protein
LTCESIDELRLERQRAAEQSLREQPSELYHPIELSLISPRFEGAEGEGMGGYCCCGVSTRSGLGLQSHLSRLPLRVHNESLRTLLGPLDDLSRPLGS